MRLSGMAKVKQDPSSPGEFKKDSRMKGGRSLAMIIKSRGEWGPLIKRRVAIVRWEVVGVAASERFLEMRNENWCLLSENEGYVDSDFGKIYAKVER